MNGTEPNIQVVKPFNEAVELTKQILFRPFDLKKWFIIGFAAWLSYLGGGFNPGFNYNQRSGFHGIPAFHRAGDAVHQIPHGVIIVAAAGLILLVVALTILFAWLRARGRFIFTDCIVRNRAAIAEPWREFRRLGNSFFLLSLLVALVFLVMAAVMAAPLLLMTLRDRMGHHHHHHDVLLVLAIVFWAGIIFVVAIAWILVSHLMTPIMYRRRCLAPEAFRAAVSLISNYPGEITLYCLFFILVAIGAGITACAVVCLTCCIAAIPYVGTVILLPIYVCLHSFGLRFVRQFGPDYDAWAGLPPAGELPAPPSVPPTSVG